MPTPIELRQRAGQIYNEARAFQTKIESEKRDFNADELAQFNKMLDDSEALISQATALERADGIGERAATGPVVPKQEGEAELKEKKTRQVPTTYQERAAYRNAVAESRSDGALHQYLQRGLDNMDSEKRSTLQADLDVGGGFFAATERFINHVLKNADEKLAIRQLATVFTVGRSESLGIPTLSSDITAFAYGAGELTTAGENTGISFGKRELKPRDIIPNVIKISRKLLESSRINIEAFVTERIGYAIARCEEIAFMTGTGAGEPLGLFTASDDGVGTARDVATGSATGFTADGLITIQGTLKDAYQPNARWLFHRDAITYIRKLKLGTGEYLWVPGLSNGLSNTILGKPYITADNVPKTLTSNLYAGMYGDFSYYWIADADSMRIQRLIETYALTGQIGLLISDLANDGMPVLAEAFVRAKCTT